MAHGARSQERPPDPQQIRVLVVEPQNSRSQTLRLLLECGYKVGMMQGAPPACRAHPRRPRNCLPWPRGSPRQRHRARQRPSALPPAQATAVQTGSEALQLLSTQLAASGEPGFDILVKEHEPPASNATRFLRKLQAADAGGVLRTLPVIGGSARAWPGPQGYTAPPGGAAPPKIAA